MLFWYSRKRRYIEHSCNLKSIFLLDYLENAFLRCNDESVDGLVGFENQSTSAAHQTEHFSNGFMGLPAWQINMFSNGNDNDNDNDK